MSEELACVMIARLVTRRGLLRNRQCTAEPYPLRSSEDSSYDNRRLSGSKVDNTGVISDFRLDYHGGQRHHVLERVPNTPDRIAEILRPISR